MPRRTLPNRSLWLALSGAALFACGFALANRFQLTHGVLYRWAAHDMAHAAGNFLWLAIQAAALLAAIALLGRRLFVRNKSGATLTARWTYGDGQVVDETSQTISPTGPAMTEFHVSKASGWPAGDYKVSIMLDGRELESKDFKVGG